MSSLPAALELPPGSPAPLPPTSRRQRWASAVRAALILIGLSPLVTWFGQGHPLLGRLVAPFELWFEFQCHRDPLRTLQVAGSPLPVCTRCLAIYLGLGLGAALVRPKLGTWGLRIWMASAVLLMLIDVKTEDLGWRPMWDATRLATGLLLAFPVGVTLVQSARES